MSVFLTINHLLSSKKLDSQDLRGCGQFKDRTSLETVPKSARPPEDGRGPSDGQGEGRAWGSASVSLSPWQARCFSVLFMKLVMVTVTSGGWEHQDG